jgi:mannan endo-1,4-beta-mannosidase
MKKFIYLLSASLLVLACLPKLASASEKILCNPQATPEAKALYAYLDSVAGKKIISGQQNAKFLDYIRTVTGKAPALMGFDFNGICPSQKRNTDSTDAAIKWVKEQGGIAQIQWHWISPNGVEDGDFYTKNVKTFKLNEALKDKESAAYKNLLRDIDLGAAELKKLQDAGVAVLWRPLHEAEGRWFWWGASGGEACKELYRLIYTRYTQHHKLNNLLWVWTSYGTTKGENWYPGDDVVDLIVWDYPKPEDWDRLQVLFGTSNKVFAMGESGKVPDPSIISTQAWAYFMTWAYMILDPADKDKGKEEIKGKNAKERLAEVYKDPRVITLEDLPKRQ